MLKKVRVSDLKRGMYVVKYGSGTFDDPFVPIERPVLNGDSVQRIIPDEVAEVWVDPSINLDLKSRARSEAQARAGGSTHEARDNEYRQYLDSLPERPIDDEIKVVEPHYHTALDYARIFMHDIRLGRTISFEEAAPLVDRFIESTYRNSTAAATMTKLRKFDEYTYTHCINVSILAIVLGKHLKRSVEELRLLGIAGLFHDVGKARVPEEILNKPGKLDDDEFRIMKSHAVEGYKLLKDQQNVPEQVKLAALEHHERHNGQGYPRGLKGENVHIISRFISVVDVYDALTSKRVYKDAIPPIRALGLMYQWRLSDFYPNSVEHFIKCIGVYPVGSFVKLSNGEYGIITRVTPGYPLHPEVKVILNSSMMPRREKILDFATLTEQGQTPPQIVDCLNPADYNVDLSRHFMSSSQQ